MRADERALADLAASVADGDPVDWQQAELRVVARDRPLVQQLRLVESISTMFRTLPLETPSLPDLAAAVADGVAVDWQNAEAQASPSERPLIRHLRLVDTISSVHRSIAPHEADAPEAIAETGPRWGHLVLSERIGQGTSCEVHRAWDTELHREVAVKLYHASESSPDALNRMLQEARRLARVKHAHVVHVYGAEQHEGRVGLWMELVRGESIEEIVKARGSLGPGEAALVGLDLCAALAAVHAAGLLHRDVKAQNVMRDSGGRVVLMDFGTGEELRQESGSARLVGTPLYLAPEIFRGRPASVQSDLYALGVLLFYACTGQFPVIAGSMEQLARAHAQGQSRRLRDLRPDLPEAYVAVVERALDDDPSRRFRSAGEMEAALRGSIGGVETRHTGTPSWALGRSRTFVAMAAALCLVVAGLLVWTRPVRPGPGPAIRSLAVLPLVDRSEVPVQWLADAMAAQLASVLSQIDGVRTTAATSSLSFKDSDMTPAAIAEALGVDALLDGIVTVTSGSGASPGNMRLELRLTTAGGGAGIWTGVFDRPRGDSEALNAAVAREIAAALNTRVSGTSAAGQRHRPTNPQAEEAYLQGRLHLAHYGPDRARRAREAFERALASDPEHAPARAGAALAYVRLGGFGVLTHAEARVSALAEVRRALDSGPATAEVAAALGDIKFLYDWDWGGAEREYIRSLELNPSFIHTRNHYAQVLAARHRFNEAVSLSQETLALDPQSGEALVNHGMILYYTGDLAGARDVAARAVARDADDAAGYVLSGRVAEAQGQYEEALEQLRHASRLSGGSAGLSVLIIRLQALAGHQAEAERAAEELERSTRLRWRDLGYLHLGLGRTASALHAFSAALDERDPALVWLTVDPRVDSLRAEPRFQAILERLGLP